jgi:MotA/TolQ/ExbB proton channel family
MSITPSQKPHREWLWLILALLLVGGITVPLWQWATPAEATAEYWSRWGQGRLVKLLLGPEQIACYLCFVWAGFMMLSRYREVLRQRAAFHFDLLPTDVGAKILPEDARPLVRKIEASARQRPYILVKMVYTALIEQDQLVTTMAMVTYLAWAIPAIGFLGTVRGLAGAMSLAGNQSDKEFTKTVADQLGVAFDCTLVALALTIPLMYMIYAVQKLEELLVIDSHAYCQENLLLRLYDPEPEPAYLSTN